MSGGLSRVDIGGYGGGGGDESSLVADSCPIPANANALDDDEFEGCDSAIRDFSDFGIEETSVPGAEASQLPLSNDRRVVIIAGSDSGSWKLHIIFSFSFSSLSLCSLFLRAKSLRVSFLGCGGAPEGGEFSLGRLGGGVDALTGALKDADRSFSVRVGVGFL